MDYKNQYSPDEPLPGPDETCAKSRHLLAMDFGTGCASMLYSFQRPGETEEHTADKVWERKKIISDYPSDPFRFKSHGSTDVPTLLWYNPDSDHPEWGWPVQQRLGLQQHEIHRDSVGVLSNIKLLFDYSPFSKYHRRRLKKQISLLIQQRRIKSEQDVVVDFLVPWLKHAKTQLINDGDITDTDRPHFAVAIPTGWTLFAHHDFVDALKIAIRKAFPVFDIESSNLDDNRVKIFTVSELHAAATFQKRLSADIRASGLNGEKYIWNFLEWFAQEEDNIDDDHDKYEFSCTHVFNKDDEEWKGSETLYHAAGRRENGWTLDHEENNNCRKLGVLELDFDEFKDNEDLKDIVCIKKGRSKCWEVTVTVTAKILHRFGHAMEFYAEWSPGRTHDSQDGSASVRDPDGPTALLIGQKTLSINSHFEPC
ncbi:hypothetical protein BDV95DRAFT_604236 [Massariosphaeria phaeospora]|uniref:Uncharacterized protein n=1 Tax=Massariosphaeria phaeospora TaxID=100035 RepID=A0A7C8MFE3_9PLEO|nr:hypothetical protein BDV95DRAFT_604236 [Massariosphaeria phaeospora]